MEGPRITSFFPARTDGWRSGLSSLPFSLRNILAMRPKHTPAKVYIFSKFSHDPSISGANPPKSIIDPYYGGLNGFETCYNQCVDFSDGFLEMLEDGRLEELKEIEQETEKVAKEGKKKNVKAGL